MPCVAINVAGSPGGTSCQRWWLAWPPAATDPVPRACGLGPGWPIGTGKVVAAPCKELSGNDLLHKGSPGSSPLTGLRGRAGAGGPCRCQGSQFELWNLSWGC